jgi:hypothetical protein
VRISMPWRGAVVAALVLCGLGGSPGATLAADTQSARSDQAVTVVGTMEGQLEAGPTGRYAYYRFTYPGGGRVASVNMQVEPAFPTVLQNAGFRVYGPQLGRIYLTSGLQPGLIPNVTGDLVSEDPGVYLVQVYNYTPTVPVAFRIWVTGLPAPDQAAVAPTDATTSQLGDGAADQPTGRARTVQQASTPETAIALTRALPGHLEAGPGGRFAYYRFSYKAGTLATINLSVTPDDGVSLRNVGFRVYGPRPGWVYASSGAQPGLTPNVSGDMRSDESGDYLVQVYQYDLNAASDFTIWGTGIPQRAVESTTENTDPSLPVAPPLGG